MQEEVENKTLTLIINGSRLTGRTLKSAMDKYLAHRRNKKLNRQSGSVTHKGKQTVKQLVGQGHGVSQTEVPDASVRDFDRVARKYGVDYAIKKERDPPRFLVFFKAQDTGAIEAAMAEYTQNKVRKASRPSVLAKLAQFKELVKKPVIDREKRKERER